MIETESQYGQAPQTVHQTIEWLKRLGRPPLPECPIEAAKQGKQPKQPCFLDGRYLKTVEWKTWQDAMPLPEIIDAWFSNPKTGVGTLGGFNGQHWLGWVDFDVKVFTSQAECDRTIAEWQEQYPILKTAPRFRTPNGGYRFLIAWESEPAEFKANSKFTLEPEGALMGELLTKNGAHTLAGCSSGGSAGQKGRYFPSQIGILYLRSHCRSVISGLRFETAGEDRLGTTRWKVTVLPHPPKPSPASPAQKAETTQSQADDHAGNRFPSLAFARSGKSEDATVQEIDLLSPAPSNNGKSKAYGTSAGDAGDSSSHPTQTVSSEVDEAGVKQADLANGHISYLAVNDISIKVGSTVNKKGKRGWVGKVTKREGHIAEVLWTGERYPTRIAVSELKLAA